MRSKKHSSDNFVIPTTQIYLFAVGRELINRAEGYNLATIAKRINEADLSKLARLRWELSGIPPIAMDPVRLNNLILTEKLHRYIPTAHDKVDATQPLIQRMAQHRGLDSAAMTYFTGDVIRRFAARPELWPRPLPDDSAKIEIVENAAAMTANKVIARVFRQDQARLLRAQKCILKTYLAPHP